MMSFVFVSGAFVAPRLAPRSSLAHVSMQQGPGYEPGGFAEGVKAKYSPTGVSTREEPIETTRPEVIDMEAAAASQAGIKAGPPDSSMAGGFGQPVVAIVDKLRVGDGILAGVSAPWVEPRDERLWGWLLWCCVAQDVGFDPLQLADDSKTLAWYREAELKHARLAMLAALGWPVAEKLNAPLAAALGQQSLLVDGRSPSVLNGGLGSVSLVYWLAALGLAIAVENSYLDAQLGKARTPHGSHSAAFPPRPDPHDTLRPYPGGDERSAPYSSPWRAICPVPHWPRATLMCTAYVMWSDLHCISDRIWSDLICIRDMMWSAGEDDDVRAGHARVRWAPPAELPLSTGSASPLIPASRLLLISSHPSLPPSTRYDPLGLDSKATRNGEIWAGRVAMVAVVVYAIEESLTKAPIM
jgi:hypothetical protein